MIENYNIDIGNATDTMKNTVKKMQELHAAKSNEVEKKYTDLIHEMESIQYEIMAIQGEPLTRDDVIRLSIQNLKSNREKIKKKILKAHFELIGNGHVNKPFSEEVMGRLLHQTEVSDLLFFVISEEDIVSCAEGISNEGLSLEERDKKVKVLEKRFTKIYDEIMKEAQDVNKK